MVRDILPPKIYSYGSVDRKSEIEKAFLEYGINNPCNYKFGDPSTIYYINKEGNIAMANPDSEIYYVISRSEDWVEIKPKEKKKYHKYLLTIKEGSQNCDGCEFHKKCTSELQDKCSFANLLTKLTNGTTFNGKTIEIEEIVDN